MRPTAAALILAVLTVAGCGGGESGRNGPDNSAGPPEVENPLPPAVGNPLPPAVENPLPPVAKKPLPPATGAKRPLSRQQSEKERWKAEAGVGKKGRGLGRGVVTTPIRAYFRTRQKLVFDMQVRPAVRLYRAQHEHFPKSHEEFMKEIIKKNNIKLPELPAGHSYVYEPQTGELMVESSR